MRHVVNYGYDISMIKSGITQDEIIKWGGAEVFNHALALVNAGDVVSVHYDDETLTLSGKLAQPSGWEMPVSLKLQARGRIQSLCPCYANQKLGQVCPHVVALGIAQMVLEMEAAAAKPPAQAPITRKTATAEPQDEFIEIPLKPQFYGFLSGSRASLSMTLDAYYGEIDFPACSFQDPKVVYLPQPDDPLVRGVRALAAERDAIQVLKTWGFTEGYRAGDLKLYLTDPQKVLNFLGAGLPHVRRLGWRIDLSDKLMALTDTMPSVVPVVSIHDATGGAFDVKYTFDAMGQEVSPVEVQAAINRGDGYILKDGAVILLDNTAISTLHDVFRDCATTQNGAKRGWFRVSGVHAPYVKASLEMLDCVDLDDHHAPYWKQTAAVRNREANTKFEEVKLGALETVLRPYQKQGVYWMRFLEKAGLCGLLADEMGLGKTLQTLTWLSLPRLNSPSRRPALIVCPTSLVRNWEAEAQKFIPNLKVLVISGPDRAQRFHEIPHADLVVTSYALLQRDFEAAYLGLDFSAIVIDEAQHIKNRQTKNAKAVKFLRAQYRLALTGTPIENAVTDVWSIFDFLMPDYLGDAEGFKLNFETPLIDGGAGAEHALATLKRKLHPFILRRVKKAVAQDLPDKIIKISYCPLNEDATREYLKALQKTRREAGDLIQAKGFQKSKFELLALLMKLRQIASQGKLESFMEQLLSAIEGGHKILIFSQFVKTLKRIAVELSERNIRFCYLDGSTQHRLDECNKFNRSPEIPVFLISLMAGGTGLNLTGADMVIHYDPWWNPAVEDQATDRAHRIGQKKNVYVMKMIASDTIEEKVLALQRKKQAIISATINTTDTAVMEKLTAADLNELLT